jgi:hypothetical protein
MRRCFAFVLLLGSLWKVDQASAQTTAVAAAAPAAPSGLPQFLGVSTDLGVPDGLNFGLVVRAASWLRLNAAAGTNSASVGGRGGATFIPFTFGRFSPTATLELGHYRMAAVNSIVGAVLGVPTWLQDYLQRFGYTYYNANLGIEFGTRRFIAFIHGGLTVVHGTASNTDPIYLDSIASADPAAHSNSARAALKQDASIRAVSPAAKAGIIFMFGGP